jgi:hypothetical protein
VAGPFFFAWCGPGQTFDSSLEREDEQIVSVEITQNEGDFAQAQIEIRNPRVGLLAPGRQLWAFLSWDSGSGVVPLFYGRIVGVPDNLTGEIVKLAFVARPLDYLERKAALADSLRVLPFWDPVWLVDKVDDPDTVLETRSSLWHVDRVTLTLSISDILVGEAGIVDVDEDSHLYDHMETTYGQPPLHAVTVIASLSWTQIGSGDVDLTREMVQSFQAAGSSGNYPMISSFTGDGLFNSWPKPGTSIGGGWSVSFASSITQASINPLTPQSDLPKQLAPLFAVPKIPGQYVLPGTYTRSYGFSAVQELFSNPGIPPGERGAYTITFPLDFYSIVFQVHYDASRKRSEVVSFNLSADVQAVQTEADQDFVLNTTGDTTNGSLVVQNIGSLAGIVPGLTYKIEGAGIPPGNTFIAVDEGQWSDPGFALHTTADTRLGSAVLDHIGSISGLIPGAVYGISGSTIPTGATFVAPSRGAILFISAPAVGNGDSIDLLITATVQGLSVTMKSEAIADATGVALTITLPAANAVEQETISLSSALVDQPIDPEGALPIRDVRLNSYFRTDRGAYSFEFLLLIARAKLLARARTVKIKFRARWEVAIALTCRHSVRLYDRRLPGGEAIGKVIEHRLSVAAATGQFGEITIGCSVGHGNTLAALDGTPDYVDVGYVEPGYQLSSGGMVTLLPGEIAYQSFDELLLDDDGVDLLNMTPANVLRSGLIDADMSISTTGSTVIRSSAVHLDNTDGMEQGLTYGISGPGIPSGATFVFFGSPVAMNAPATATLSASVFAITGQTELTSVNGISVTNGPPAQRRAVDAAIDGVEGLFSITPFTSPRLPDPTAALSAAPTRVAVNLVSVTGGPFQTIFEPAVSTLMVPKTIDLEAPSA